MIMHVLKSTLILAIYANTREIPRFADFIEFHGHHTNFRKFSETTDGIAKKMTQRVVITVYVLTKKECEIN